MDQQFVNLLIQQFINKTSCPQCGSEILPTNVKIQNINAEKCHFSMQCKKCKAVISADAQLSEANVSLKQEKNTSTQQPQKAVPQSKAKKASPKQEVVNLNDLMQMKKQLGIFPGSFKQLFQ